MPIELVTHEVLNQPPPFEGGNHYLDNAALSAAVERHGAGAHREELTRLGAAFASAEAAERARLANEHPPRLRAFDRQGRRLDVVEYHPAYHACMRESMAAGLHSSTWEHLATAGAQPLAGAHVRRGAGLYMAAQMEAGHCCPITMTHAAVPTLLLSEPLAREWLPRILSRTYDPAFRPAAEKASATIGMGMTEKQGGTDVRANTTRAEPIGTDSLGRRYRLIGHKWFMSAPMCDAFLVLAQAPGGLSCFLLPRFLPEGRVNALAFQRLKDKLGNRSNASSEVEFLGAEGWLIGEEGRGVPAIINMVSATRLDCALSSAGLMRLALAMAIHHARHRTVFQRRLVDQPLMTGVLADMALDVEAATALSMRLAAAVDQAAHSTEERAFARLMTPVVKLWVCKLAPTLVYEAMECLGGNGYVEEGVLARIYREVPVNAIWEGSGNVMALDVVRVVQRERETVELALGRIRSLAAGERTLLTTLDAVENWMREGAREEGAARVMAELLALAAAGTILHAQAPPVVADAFIRQRLGEPRGRQYGNLHDLRAARAIVERALPPMA